MHFLEKIKYQDINRYIEQRLKPVTIDDIPVMEKIKRHELEGECWQSTTFLSIFFDDNSLVARGKLTFLDRRSRDYPHSWIEFEFKNKKYIFDPALAYLNLKENYYHELQPRATHHIPSLEIKNSLINLKNDSHENTIYIRGTNNIQDPFFRTHSDFSIIIKPNNEIEKLNIKFYSNG